MSGPAANCLQNYSLSPQRCTALLPAVARSLWSFRPRPIEDESRQHAAAHLHLIPKHRRPSAAIRSCTTLWDSDYRVSGGSFFQTNRFLIDTLAQVVIANRRGRAALDLYAGVGLFTLPLARNFDQVLAVESSPHSFADLRHNVPANVKCIRATTEAFLAERGAKLAPDLRARRSAARRAGRKNRRSAWVVCPSPV